MPTQCTPGAGTVQNGSRSPAGRLQAHGTAPLDAPAQTAMSMQATEELVDVGLLLGLWQQEPRKQVIDRLVALHGSLSMAAQQALVWLLQHDPVLQALPVREHYLGRLVKQIVIAAEDEGLELDDQLVELLHAQLMHSAKAGSPWSHRTYYYTRQPDTPELWQLSKEHAARVAAGDRRSGSKADSTDCVRHSSNGDASSCSAGSSDAIAAGVAVAKSSVANMRRRNGVNVASGGSTGSSDGDGSTGNGTTGNGTSTSSGSAATNNSSLPSGVMTLWVSDNLFEGGTGCHPWEAGFRLAEFVMSNPELFAGRSCLELGCGSGLLGMALVRAGASQVVLTDGDPMAVTNCCRNLRLNGIAADIGVPSCSTVALSDLPCASSDDAATDRQQSNQQASVCCCQMTWEAPEQELSAEVIVGADILYDPKVVPSLLTLLKDLLMRCRQRQQQLTGVLQTQQQPTQQMQWLALEEHTSQVPTTTSTEHHTFTQNGAGAMTNGICSAEACGTTYTAVHPMGASIGQDSRRSNAAATQASRPEPVAYLATTLRNEQTMQLFETQAAAAGLQLQEVPSSRGSDWLQFQQVSVLNDEVRQRIRLHRVSLC